MATTADFKNGLCIDFNGKPCTIVWFQHVKPGKGGAFVKVKVRNLESGRILENTYNAGEKIDIISIERRPYQFLTRMIWVTTLCIMKHLSRYPWAKR